MSLSLLNEDDLDGPCEVCGLPHRRWEYAIACGLCNAKPHKPCRDIRTRKVMDKPHGARTYDALLLAPVARWRTA